ncbi:hypothetical protein Pan181_51030 [Aeoliella mucimassa]|uniref:Uncharacterized protein n=1 Tax=Aeoliella mucimassa TaxID=2527972 RepID=A0A518AVW8_9BACT|nr:hypothetical protein Pan181_51030 [Aeoliella mucimassa]
MELTVPCCRDLGNADKSEIWWSFTIRACKVDKVQKRFSELNTLGQAVQNSKNHADLVNAELYVQWRTSAHSLLRRVFGEYHPTHQAFSRRVMEVDNSSRTYVSFRNMWAVFQSARDEFEGGYLFDLTNLVRRPGSHFL